MFSRHTREFVAGSVSTTIALAAVFAQQGAPMLESLPVALVLGVLMGLGIALVFWIVDAIADTHSSRHADVDALVEHHRDRASRRL